MKFCKFLDTFFFTFYGEIFVSQKAVRVTTLMKRLRGPDQTDSGAAGAAAGAAADANTPGGGPAPPAGGGLSMAATLKAALKEKASDTQTATNPAQSLQPGAQQEEQQSRCNGEAPQMVPQRKGD